MSTYVDEIVERPKSEIKPAQRYFGTRWSNLTADTLAELHVMADQLGLQPRWYQPSPFPHYDLVPNKRKKALDAGAVFKAASMQVLEGLQTKPR